jgi:hypothetical protein
MELRLRVTRRRVALVAVLVGLVTAGVAYATIPDGNGVFTACKLNATGTIRLIDPSLSGPLGRCSTSLETQIGWNQRGQQGLPGPQGAKGEKGDPGKDGVGVTSANEPAGTKCAYGGSAFTAANGTTYACNGAPGLAGGLPALHYVEAQRVAFGTSQGETVQTTPAEVRCPVNEAAIGGSFINNWFHRLVVRSSYSTGDPRDGTSAWVMEMDNDTANDLGFSVSALCVPVA